MTIHLAVIGGGPKAAAIAARAWCLTHPKQKGRTAQSISITIFEQSRIGANWTGKSGYTDGDQRLCTPIERDLGFPYVSSEREVDELLFETFSWGSYLQRKSGTYREWVDHKRKPPSHSDFADYLEWAVKRSEAKVVIGKVSKLLPSAGKWRVGFQAPKASRRRFHPTLFDGVVVSGHGPANRLPSYGVQNAAFFNGQDFWSKLARVRRILKRLRADEQIAIIGAGGTAAAILAWLMRNGQANRPIALVADQAAFFTRGDSVFENALFSDVEAWKRMTLDMREDFSERLNRAVVWDTVMEQVSEAKQLVFESGRALRVSMSRGAIKIEVNASNGERFDLRPGLAIDASGFDALWFLNLVDLPTSHSFKRGEPRDVFKTIVAELGPGLCLGRPSWKLPPLHAPMMSSAYGPGLSSLMSLGAMADWIIKPYLDR